MKQIHRQQLRPLPKRRTESQLNDVAVVPSLKGTLYFNLNIEKRNAITSIVSYYYI